LAQVQAVTSSITLPTWVS